MSEKRTEKEQKGISADITALKAKMEEEAAVHDEIVEYLKSAHAKLADKVAPPISLLPRPAPYSLYLFYIQHGCLS